MYLGSGEYGVENKLAFEAAGWVTGVGLLVALLVNHFAFNRGFDFKAAAKRIIQRIDEVKDD